MKTIKFLIFFALALHLVSPKKSAEELIFLARVAEQAEMYKDMVLYILEALQPNPSTINVDERILLQVAFTNRISNCRTAIRTITSFEQNPKYHNLTSTLLGY
jgi:hypothetical protein